MWQEMHVKSLLCIHQQDRCLHCSQAAINLHVPAKHVSMFKLLLASNSRAM
jgi:hypothetical protein